MLPQVRNHKRLFLVLTCVVFAGLLLLTACDQTAPTPVPAPKVPDYIETETFLLTKGEVVDITFESTIRVECDKRPGTIGFWILRVKGNRTTSRDYKDASFCLDRVDNPTFEHYIGWGAILYEGRRGEKAGEPFFATAVRFIVYESGNYHLDLYNYKPKLAEITYRVYKIGEIDLDRWESEYISYFNKYRDYPLGSRPYEPLTPPLQKPPTGGYPPTIEKSITLGPYT